MREENLMNTESRHTKYYTLSELARWLDPPTSVATIRMWCAYSYVPRPRKREGSGWLVFTEQEAREIQSWRLSRLVNGLTRGRGAKARIRRAREIAARQFAAGGR
jgi:hypothetical protein